MQSKTITSIVIALCALCAIVYLRSPSPQELVTVQSVGNKQLISINAKDTTVDEILAALKNKCNLETILMGYKLPTTPVTFSFNNMHMQNAIPVIMQIADISSYALQPLDGPEKFALYIGSLPKTAKSSAMRQPVANSPMPTARTQVENSAMPAPRPSFERQTRDDIKVAAKAAPVTAEDEASPKTPEKKPEPFEKKVQEFKSKYQWDDAATMNLGEHLLGTIPEGHRDVAMSAMMRNLDEAQKNNKSGSVDETMLMQAIEKTMPEAMKPSLQKAVQKYKDDSAG